MKEIEKQIKECLPRLKKYIFFKVSDSYEAEEILQETLIAAHESYPFFKGKSSFFTWLCAIANHEIADFYRKKKIKTILFSRFPWLDNLVSEALGPEQELLKKEFEQEVGRTLLHLGEGYREVLRLKYYQGLKVIEIAKKLNESTKAIESRLGRARKAFAQAFTTNSS
ncbi:MAG: RNA polymerase sigma factor [Microgenomates group bacterium]